MHRRRRLGTVAVLGLTTLLAGCQRGPQRRDRLAEAPPRGVRVRAPFVEVRVPYARARREEPDLRHADARPADELDLDIDLGDARGDDF